MRPAGSAAAQRSAAGRYACHTVSSGAPPARQATSRTKPVQAPTWVSARSRPSALDAGASRSAARSAPMRSDPPRARNASTASSSMARAPGLTASSRARPGRPWASWATAVARESATPWRSPSQAAISDQGTAAQASSWQRERMVAGSRSGWAAARTMWLPGGGSSRVLRTQLAACSVRRSARPMTAARRPPA